MQNADQDVIETRTCIERGCGNEFTITQRDVDFFNSKNWTLPKRCKPCRAKLKAQKEAAGQG